jgi:cytochrome c5
MLKRVSVVLCGILLLMGALKVFAGPQNSTVSQKPAKAANNANAGSDAGEKAFRQNCGRCHNPPESLSPREVKAVLQHMRVRAMLTAKDEQLILKYLAP